jgi:hypothetical protein
VFPSTTHTLEQSIPESFDDYVCKTCDSKHPILHSYGILSPNTFLLAKKAEEETLDSLKEVALETVEKDDSVCQLANALDPTQKDSSAATLSVDLFLLDNWRESLCHCVSCLEMYKSNGVSFLVEEQEETYEPPVDPRAGIYYLLCDF